ncbi:MAG: hypothetical protein HFG25_02790 [Lachnospiraceae bacterium]|nr:hypothetical protein [Lachnospiraceae bacterium]
MVRDGIIFQNSVFIDHWQFFWSENYNALYKRKLVTGEICRLSAYADYERAAYTKLVRYKRKLIALPSAADKILVFDLDTEEFRYSETGIPEMEDHCGNSEKFYGCVEKDNWLFMIGCKTAHILKFDMDAEKTAGYLDLHRELSEKADGMGYFREGAVFEEKILVPALYENSVFEVDIENLRYSRKTFSNTGKGFSLIYRADSQIWLFPFDRGEIIIWDGKKEIVSRYNIDGFIRFKRNSRNFLAAYMMEGKLWIIPRMANKVLTFDFAEKQFYENNAVNAYFTGIDKEISGISSERLGENILLLTACTDRLILYNTLKDEIELICNNWIPDDDFMRFLWKRRKMAVVSEKDICLRDFIKFVEAL